MVNKKLHRNCLVISYGPVPTPQYQTIEGGGMRAWGLAKGLAANGVDVTVAMHESFPQEIQSHDGIKLTNWAQNSEFVELINSYDSVIMSYCMGDPSVFVADNIQDDVQLILDVYVPIYVEVSARDASDMASEYPAYQSDVARHNRVLKRGDYFICANEVQKIFYTGVLGGLGVINPLSYRQDRIKIVPFGIHNTEARAAKNPYAELGIKKTDKTIMWFGGLYPWFRLEELLDAVRVLSEKDPSYKFVVVGGKNPFNNNPDLLKQYEFAQKYAKSHKLLDKSVFFVDWVDYDTRVDWYEYADFVISINQPGEENTFAWRTRVMDFIWGGVVTLTNGGDPLGDELLQNGAAIGLADLKSTTIADTIVDIYAAGDTVRDAKNSLIKLRPKYYWDNVTKKLSELITDARLPYKDERTFALTNNVELGDNFESPQVRKSSKLATAIKNPRKVVSYARKKGIRRSAKLGASIVGNQLKKRVSVKGDFVFISHPIDNTGAPLVMLQIIDEVVAKYGGRRVRVIAPYIDKKILADLRRKNIKVEKAAIMSYGLTAAQLSLKSSDLVFMNTLAIYDNYREVVFNLLAHNRISKAHWFIHEDEEQLRVVGPDIGNKSNIKKINKLISKDKLHIYVPSKRVKLYYDGLFETERVVAVPLRVDVPDEYKEKKAAKDYAKINFYLSGTPTDGRKGQLIAISALQDFLLRYRRDNPERYRDFSLHLVSIADDYVSQQIKSIGASTLGNRLQIYPSVPRDDALVIASKCNAVICCSLNETFGLYIAEGMLMGHIVLRNNSAGVDEQLSDGKNGYLVTDSVPQFADKIERILNKKTTSDEQLCEMGQYSQKMMSTYVSGNYLDYIDLVTDN